MHLGPALVPGRLERHSVCACGREFIKRTTPLGKYYDADVKSVRWAKLECAGCGKIQEIRIVDIWDREGFSVMWFPLAVLDLDIAIKGPKKPASWEKVYDNKLAPALPIPESKVIQ